MYENLLGSAPNHSGALNNLGTIYLSTANIKTAIDCFRRAVGAHPHNSDAWNNLGVSLAESGNSAEALACYEKALAQAPQDPEILTNIGSVLCDLGRTPQAEDLHRKALAIDPQNRKAHNNLARTFQKKGDLQSAVRHYRKALKIDGTDERIYFNLAQTLVDSGDLSEAVEVSNRALHHFPASMTSIIGAARVFIECGHWEKADPLLQSAINYPYRVHELNVLRHLLLFLIASRCGTMELARIHFLCGRLIAEKIKSGNKKPGFDLRKTHAHSKKLRIGYVSPDFNRHSVGWLIKEILRHHDTDKLEICCYSISDKEDDITRDIENTAKTYRRMSSLSDFEAARSIAEDGIQILVDLAGYTRRNRMEIFSHRPAPVQVTAIGYPHGTGLDTMDYRLSDPDAEGVDAVKEYREKLLCFPRFFLPLPPLEASPEKILKTDFGIPEEAFIFVSFNSWHKLRPEVFTLWDRILNRIPNAYLIFSFRHAQTEYAQSRVCSYFLAGRKRLVFLPQTETEEQHRNRYRIADIALDPFPYSGTTTSWEALFMGTPVITLKGDRHSQRTTWSLLAHLGLDMLGADTEKEYMDIAVNLAENPARLHYVKHRTKEAVQKALQIGNEPYVKALEDQYRRIWRDYTASSLTQ